MPTVFTPTPTKVNTFWVAANIIFDLGTGETKQVLLLVNKLEDATLFTAEDAQTYTNLVKQRAKNIVWQIEETQPLRQLFDPVPPQRFAIKGIQYVG